MAENFSDRRLSGNLLRQFLFIGNGFHTEVTEHTEFQIGHATD